MIVIGRFLILTLLSLVFYVVYASTIWGYSSNNVIIRQLYFDPSYEFWIQLDFDFECFDYSIEKLDKYVNKLQNLDLKGSIVVYINNFDIVNCIPNIVKIIEVLNNKNFLVALDFDHTIDLLSLYDNNMNYNTYFFEKYKIEDFNDIDLWVSYVVFSNIRNFLTINERRDVLLNLRNLFPRSKIGFKFDKDIYPTIDFKHPNRPNINWDLIKPIDDDGDFIITPWMVNNFKRTLVISDGSWVGYNNGQIIKLGADYFK